MVITIAGVIWISSQSERANGQTTRFGSIAKESSRCWQRGAGRRSGSAKKGCWAEEEGPAGWPLHPVHATFIAAFHRNAFLVDHDPANLRKWNQTVFPIRINKGGYSRDPGHLVRRSEISLSLYGCIPGCRCCSDHLLACAGRCPYHLPDPGEDHGKSLIGVIVAVSGSHHPDLAPAARKHSSI